MQRFVIVLFSVVSVFAFTSRAVVGQSFVKKIGDGWKHGNWLPGVPSVRPQTWQEVVFPICWGAPQKCRDAVAAHTPNRPAPLYSVSFTVDCEDTKTKQIIGDATNTFTSPISLDAARGIALNAYQTTNLCQTNPKWGKDPDLVAVNGHFDDDQSTIIAATKR